MATSSHSAKLTQRPPPQEVCPDYANGLWTHILQRPPQKVLSRPNFDAPSSIFFNVLHSSVEQGNIRKAGKDNLYDLSLSWLVWCLLRGHRAFQTDSMPLQGRARSQTSVATIRGIEHITETRGLNLHITRRNGWGRRAGQGWWGVAGDRPGAAPLNTT